MAEEGNTRQRRRPKRVLLAILAVGLMALLAVVILGQRLLRRRPGGCRGCGVVCGTNVSGLAKAMLVYANDEKDPRLPPADQWCDLLIKYDYTTAKQFVCRDSDAVEGESSYAINKNVAGKELALFPDDMVFVFETDYGKDANGRQGLLKNRGFYETTPFGNPNTKVYKNRWNQAGGPEILTTEHHGGDGCNVAFISTRVAFVPTAELAKLRWKADANDK